MAGTIERYNVTEEEEVRYSTYYMKHSSRDIQTIRVDFDVVCDYTGTDEVTDKVATLHFKEPYMFINSTTIINRTELVGSLGEDCDATLLTRDIYGLDPVLPLTNEFGLYRNELSIGNIAGGPPMLLSNTDFIPETDAQNSGKSVFLSISPSDTGANIFRLQGEIFINYIKFDSDLLHDISPLPWIEEEPIEEGR